MKKVLLSCAMLLCGLVAMAQTAGTPTTDKLVLSAKSVLIPGDDSAKPYVEVTVSLQGSSVYYTAYQADIILPPGLEVAKSEGQYMVSIDKKSDIYPLDWSDELTHQLSFTYGKKRPRDLKVTCFASDNAVFETTSGSLFKFYVHANSCAKPGAAEIQIKGVVLTELGTPSTSWLPSDRTDTNVTVSDAAKVAINIPAENKWSTLVCPFDATLPTGLTAYSVDRTEDAKAYLKSEASIQAYTPYVIKAESGFTGTLNGTVDTSKYPAGGVAGTGLLLGAVEDQSIASGYILQKKDGETAAKFYQIPGTANMTVPSGKCWLNPSSSAKEISLVFEDPTAINTVNINSQQSTVNGQFNLAGQKVNADYKGIVISNGKKVLK